MKKYRLLKDLPGLLAGAEYRCDEQGEFPVCKLWNGEHALGKHFFNNRDLSQVMIEDNPEWFELVEEEKVIGMKQHITAEQVKSLSDKAKNRLRAWWNSQPGDHCVIWPGEKFIEQEVVVGAMHDYEVQTETSVINDNALPLLSIGQMIEFLFHNDGFTWAWDTEGAWLRKGSDFFIGGVDKIDELCDVLWELVKETLEKTAP